MSLSIKELLIFNDCLLYSQSTSEICMPFYWRLLLLDCCLLIILYYYSCPKCCSNILSIFINMKAAFFLCALQTHIKCKSTKIYHDFISLLRIKQIFKIVLFLIIVFVTVSFPCFSLEYIQVFSSNKFEKTKPLNIMFMLW